MSNTETREFTSYKFLLIGKPESQKRPRFSTRSGKVRVYDPSADRKKIDRARLTRQMWQVGLMQRIQTECAVIITAHFGSLSNHGEPRPKGPDADNIAKYYLDLMNDLVFKDDRIVTDLVVKKRFSKKSMVEIEVIA